MGRIHEALTVLRAARRPLERAIAEGGGIDDFDGVYQDVAGGRMQLFAAGQSVLVTQIQEYPRARVLQLCYAAGRLADLEPWLDAVLAWGKSKGCTKAVMIGRRGWERTFLRNRLQPTNVVMEGTL